MSAVGLGQQRSEATGPGSNQIFAVSDIFTISLTFTISLSKIVLTPPPLTYEFFSDTRIFLEKRRVPYQVFHFGLVRQNFLRQYSDAPLSYAWNFSIPEIFWNTEGFPHVFFWHCETKSFRRKIVIPLSLIDNFFYIPENFWNTEGTPYEVFRSCETKNFRQNHDAPLLSIRIFDTRIFWSTEGFPCEIFRHCETKKRIVISDIPFLCIKFFDTRSFRKHWRVSHEIFRHCEMKDFRRKTVIPPICYPLVFLPY